MRLRTLLSVDGGGMRGLIPALWLARIEALLAAAPGQSLVRHFDLLAGNSTGALVVCSLAAGLAPAQLAQLYRDAGRMIFTGAGSRRPKPDLSAPAFDPTGLERVLRRLFGDLRLGALSPPVLLLAYDTIGRRAVVFKSFLPEHRDLPVWEVCRASTAAPTYFPAHLMRIDGQDLALIDGGVVANNPALCAVAEALRRDPGPVSVRDLLLLSLGTGRRHEPIAADQARGWGARDWAQPILDVVFGGSGDANHYIASYLLGADYFRMQTDLECGFGALEDASGQTMARLERLAMDYLELAPTRASIARLLERLRQRAAAQPDPTAHAP